jgi:hypothetical protein
MRQAAAGNSRQQLGNDHMDKQDNTISYGLAHTKVGSVYRLPTHPRNHHYGTRLDAFTVDHREVDACCYWGCSSVALRVCSVVIRQWHAVTLCI